MDSQTHPLDDQMLAVVAHYGVEQVLASLAMALVQTAENMQSIGADAQVVSHHRQLGAILAQAAT